MSGRKKFDGVHASYFLALKECAKCRETIFAAEGATLVPAGVEFQWHCDLCGYKFKTIDAVEIEAAA